MTRKEKAFHTNRMQGGGTSEERTYLNEHQAAEYLGLGVGTLRRWRWSGTDPPFYKFGSAVRYSLTDLQEYAKKSRRISTTDNGGAA